MTEAPLAIDLYHGLGGWSEGLVATGFRVIGVDIVDMHREIGEPMPEGDILLILQDVMTLHGSQFKDARLIVGSSPCTKYSYMAMPWTKAKDLAAWYRDPDHPERLVALNALYDAQFRIQREACEAAGRFIPMVVENVRGAIPWVGRSAWNFGSYHLWGDVPALMPSPAAKSAIKAPGLGNGWVHPSDPRHTPGLDFTRLAARSEEDGRKVPGFRFDGSGRSFQTASVAATREEAEIGQLYWTPEVAEGRKHHGDWFRDPDATARQGGQLKPPARVSKNPPADGRKGAGAGAEWFDQNTSSLPSNSPRRRAASAKIAKIPFALAHWIGKAWMP